MELKALERVNSDTVEKFKNVKEDIIDTYLNFAKGLVAVIVMAVFPIVLQMKSEELAGREVAWGPTIVAVLMGAVLTFAWVMRFRKDKELRRKYEDRQLDNLQKMAAAVTAVHKTRGLGAIEVDASGKVPQLVQMPAA